jgi:hypothetical protein
MNLLDRGQRWLTGQMAQHAGTRVLFRRGPISIMLDRVVKLRREVEVIDEDGMPTIIQVFEFRVESEAFLLSGITPRTGDQLVETIDGEDSHYELMPTQGMPTVKDGSNDRHRMSLLTKRVC